MTVIKDLEQLINNIHSVEKYLTEGNSQEKEEIIKLIKRGTCFVAYQIVKETRFAPSRFIGYIDNSLSKHKNFNNKDGRETNKAINKLLEPDPTPNKKLEKAYLEYCSSLGIDPGLTGAFGAPRKYWTFKLDNDFQENLESNEGFPEGKLVERIHLAKERNYQVIKIAKDNFKKKHGKLFCQICQFNFEDKYGLIGQDFIEGHHTIPVKDMKEGHMTKPDDIALLCSNCHKMIHKRRPWLTMTELIKLLK